VALYPSLNGRRILITGGGRGFGREMALAFARQGARLLLTAARNGDELGQTVADANAIAPGCCIGELADVALEADCTRIASVARGRLGGIDVLLNNAARSPAEAMTRFDRAAPTPFWEADATGYERLIVTNIVGPFLMAQRLAPAMVQQGFGRIVNMLTSGPTMTVSGRGPYGASKAALEASTAIWARDLAGSGVTVNGLLPGGASDTALIPGDNIGQRAIPGFRAGKNSGGASEGTLAGLLPANIIVPPALWLAADESAAWTGRRFVAKDWDDTLGWESAAEQSVTEMVAVPRIL
jgi:3-oxoacyl-[acyl-carrier protein] reductase